MACQQDFDFTITINPPIPAQCEGEIRIQVFDDGAGEYLIDTPVSTFLIAGDNGVPFFLPSPLVISKRGLVTITMSNINDQTHLPVNGYLGLIFAVRRDRKAGEPLRGT